MRKRRWTDEQLRKLVATSTTWVEVLRGLGLSPKGRNHYNVMARAALLDLDTSHFDVTIRRTADAALRLAIANADSFEAVADQLDLDQGRETRDRLRSRARALGIDTAHFHRRQVAPTRTKQRRWTDEQLRAAVAAARSLARVLRTLGLVAAGGNYESVQRRIHELAVDTSHFTGKGWNVDLQYQPAPARPLEELLVRDRWISSYHLKGRLFRARLKEPKCERCGWAESAPDGRVPVELDHINGDRNDNRLENLRILCPNCHSLQSTHRGLNQKRRRRE
jgi:hypothetical protein